MDVILLEFSNSTPSLSLWYQRQPFELKHFLLTAAAAATAATAAAAEAS